MGEDATITPLTDLDGARAEWSALAERTGNPFLTWEWATTWWRELGAGHELAVFGVHRPDGSLAAILPLHLTRAGRRTELRFLGHDVSDQVGPLCAPADRGLAARGMRAALRRTRADLLVGQFLPGDEGWAQRLGGMVTEREACPVLRFEGQTWAELLQGRSRNFREQVGRRERGLRRKHPGMAFRLADDPARLGADLDAFLGLHEQRFAESSSAFSEGRAAFHHAWARTALEHGWLRLWLLELDERPVAAWYAFRFGGTEWLYQSGRDPALENDRVGFVLLVHAMRTACDEGMAAVSFLRGDEGYKGRFANEDPGLERVVAGRGALGRGLVAYERAKPGLRRVRDRVRPAAGEGS